MCVDNCRVCGNGLDDQEVLAAGMDNICGPCWNDEHKERMMYEFKRKLQDKIDDANNCLAVQGTDGNWDYDEYMRGMYNGMEMIQSIYEEREPIFKDAPYKKPKRLSLRDCFSVFLADHKASRGK
jgi:hypothetical protein